MKDNKENSKTRIDMIRNVEVSGTEVIKNIVSSLATFLSRNEDYKYNYSYLMDQCDDFIRFIEDVQDAMNTHEKYMKEYKEIDLNVLSKKYNFYISFDNSYQISYENGEYKEAEYVKVDLKSMIDKDITVKWKLTNSNDRILFEEITTIENMLSSEEKDKINKEIAAKIQRIINIEFSVEEGEQ